MTAKLSVSRQGLSCKRRKKSSGNKCSPSSSGASISNDMLLGEEVSTGAEDSSQHVFGRRALGKRILDEGNLDLNMNDFPLSSVAWGLVIIF